MAGTMADRIWICGVVAAITGMCVSAQDPLLRNDGPKLNMTAIHASATLYLAGQHGTIAHGAIDEDTRIGQSGRSGWEKCASTDVYDRRLLSRYMMIDLRQQRYITAVRLHLRDNDDNVDRRSWQNGLAVELTNLSSHVVEGMQCGEAFNATKHGQSPIFHCFNKAQYILIALRQTKQPLQICEVEAYQVPKLDLSKNGRAALYPDVLSITAGKARPGKAIDGHSNIGQSGGTVAGKEQILNCASTELARRTSLTRAYQYLRIGLPAFKHVYFVRLHLRDNDDYPKWQQVIRRADQDGLIVMVSDGYDRSNPTQCGLPYDPTTQGQSPAFTCNVSGQYVWMILNSTNGKSLQVCEAEIYATGFTKKCQDLLNSRIPNGRIIVSGEFLGNTAVYRCNGGYKVVVGDIERKCQNDGTWTGVRPICRLKSCKRLPDPKKGYRIGSDVTVGTFIAYTCMRGYRLIGSSSRKCLPSGQWSGTQPVCQHKCAVKQSNPSRECIINGNGDYLWQCLSRSQCPSEFSQMCGTDGVTYNSKCIMKVMSCNAGGKEIQVAGKGECRYGGVCSEGQPERRNGVACRAFLYRYWFNQTSKRCEQYAYGGCFEGRNSFYTEEDCQETCLLTDPCKLPRDPGVCEASEMRYFFDSLSNTCKRFTYSGCFGNENNFKDQRICTKTCCVCESQTRKKANEQRDTVIFVRINSLRTKTPRQGIVRYRAKVLEDCKPPSRRTNHVIRENDVAFLEVTEILNDRDCYCPKLRKTGTYKVGVDVLRRTGRTWEMKVPRKFYVKEANGC